MISYLKSIFNQNNKTKMSTDIKYMPIADTYRLEYDYKEGLEKYKTITSILILNALKKANNNAVLDDSFIDYKNMQAVYVCKLHDEIIGIITSPIGYWDFLLDFEGIQLKKFEPLDEVLSNDVYSRNEILNGKEEKEYYKYWAAALTAVTLRWKIEDDERIVRFGAHVNTVGNTFHRASLENPRYIMRDESKAIDFYCTAKLDHEYILKECSIEEIQNIKHSSEDIYIKIKAIKNDYFDFESRYDLYRSISEISYENKILPLEVLQRGAESGNPIAMFEYSIRTKDYNKYLEEAGNLGIAEAFIVLGNIYYNGESTGGIKDEEKGYLYYEKAAKTGHPIALEKIAEKIEKGQGTRKNLQKAADIYYYLTKKENIELYIPKSIWPINVESTSQWAQASFNKLNKYWSKERYTQDFFHEKERIKGNVATDLIYIKKCEDKILRFYESKDYEEVAVNIRHIVETYVEYYLNSYVSEDLVEGENLTLFEKINMIYKNDLIDQHTFKVLNALREVGNEGAHEKSISKDSIDRSINQVKEIIKKYEQIDLIDD